MSLEVRIFGGLGVRVQGLAEGLSGCVGFGCWDLGLHMHWFKVEVIRSAGVGFSLGCLVQGWVYQCPSHSCCEHSACEGGCGSQSQGPLLSQDP